MKKLAQVVSVVLAVVGSQALAEAQAAKKPPSNKKCLMCHSDPAFVVKFEDGTTAPGFVDEAKFAASIHGEKLKLCVDCHVDIDIEKHQEWLPKNRRSYSEAMAELCRKCHRAISDHFSDDAHSKKLGGAAACQDCHDPHYTSHPAYPREKISHTCEKCHKPIYSQYAESVHGVALRRNNLDVPVCTDCHKAHSLNKDSRASIRLNSIDLCWGCHGDQTKMSKYGISTEGMKTYVQDFHSVDLVRAMKEGRPPVADLCIRCHDVHAIKKVTDEVRKGLRAHAQTVCVECHKGVPPGFAGAMLTHQTPSLQQAPLVFVIRLSYWIFIPFVIFGLVIHIIFDVVHLRRRVQSGRVLVPADQGRTYVRFNVLRRTEHIMVIAVFTTLLVTGLPQKFHTSDWAEWLINAFGGLKAIQLIHRIAGIVFTVQALGHMLVNIVGILAGKMRPDMLATRRDFPDTILGIRHALGLTMEKPKGDRYDFRQKFEYWGMVIGGMVMIATGFTLLFPTALAHYLPAELIPAAKVAHSFEAMMAFLVVLVWHFYCAHFKVEFFPSDPCIFTGKISHHRMMEEHELELERLEKKEKESKGTVEQGAEPGPEPQHP